jgi:hypothetical protein
MLERKYVVVNSRAGLSNSKQTVDKIQNLTSHVGTLHSAFLICRFFRISGVYYTIKIVTLCLWKHIQVVTDWSYSVLLWTKDNEVHSRNHCCHGKALRITYFCVCVCVRARVRACAFARVALLIEHATHRRHIVCGFSSFITSVNTIS